MKRMIVAAVIILLACSTAFGGWRHPVPVVVPAPVVHAYWPVGPVYAYPPVVVRAPVVVVPRRIVYRAPVVVVPRRIVYRAPVVVPRAVWYAPPVTVRSKVYIYGRPVRNAIRAVLP